MFRAPSLPFIVVLCTLLACPPPEDPGDPDTTPPTDVVDSEVAPPDSDPPLPSVATLTEGEEVVCEAPELRATEPFILHLPEGDWQNQRFDPNSSSLFVGGGVTVADLNGDGVLDLLMTAYDARVALYEGQADLSFIDRSATLPPMPERTAGATAVDFDGDLDLDVFVTAFKGPDVMLRNDGDALFSDVAEALGLQGAATGRTMSSSWADIDRDGDLDGFVAGYGRLSSPEGLPPGDPSSLLFQQDDGTFYDAVDELGDPHPLRGGHSFVGGFTDVDGDGWLDMFLVNDFGWKFPTMLLSNHDGALTWDGESGVELRWENMGLGIADINGDLIPDFLVGAWSHLGLLLSRDGTWFESGEYRGVIADHDREQLVGWGTELADVDNDGDIDAFAAFGFLPVQSNNVNPAQQPDALFRQHEAGQFVDVADDWGVADGSRSRGFVLADLDRNGWLDLIKRDLRGPTKIYLGQCGTEAWLGVHLRQQDANRYAIGARVILTAGEQRWVRELRAGGTSYGSSGPPELHFGLGHIDHIDHVEIRWPDGSFSEFEDVSTRRFITVVRP